MNCRTGIAVIITLGITGTALAEEQVEGATVEGKDSPSISAEQLTDDVDRNIDPAVADDLTAEVSPQSVPVYVPPRRGAPKTRVGGGTRSSGSDVQLALLAPEHTGLTSRPSPRLYWWLSKDHEGPFEFVVMVEGGVEPVLRFREESRLVAGIHSFDLAAAGLSLEPGIAYRWSVAIVRDETQRARDVVALATMEYVTDREVAEQAGTLAAAGLWYDAIAMASVDIDPAARTDLLEQVALDQVAQWSRSGGTVHSGTSVCMADSDLIRANC